MKRMILSQLTCGLAFALLFNPSVTPTAWAQSGGNFGGSFATPVQSGSFSTTTTPRTVQSPTTSAQSFPGSSFGSFNPTQTKSTRLPAASGAGNFNPTPFKVTKPATTSKPAFQQRPAVRQAKVLAPSKPAPLKPALTKPTPTKFQTSHGTARPTTFGRPASFPAQGRTSFGASPTTPRVQMTSNESSAGATNRPPATVDCPISSVHFIEDILLPAREAGEIKSMNFKEGDFVPAGQTIAQINDENYQMLLEQADMRLQIAMDTASDSTATIAAKKKYQVAAIEAKKTARLAENGSKSASEKMMATYSKEIAGLEVQKAEQDRRKALAEAKLAQAEKRQVLNTIARHTLRSDFDAYVVEIKKHKQEYVQVGEEVMRLARMDRVWVQSVVNTKELNAHELMNKKVTVTIDLARGETAEFEGIVKFVGLERQGPELLMVKAEVTNRPINSHWILHPEAEVSMKIHLDDEDGAMGSIGSTSITH